MKSLIREKKGKTDIQGLDFIQLLLNAELDVSDDVGGNTKLSDDEIVAQCLIFVLAGYETSSSVLQFLAYELTRNPDIQKRIVAEMKEEIPDGELPNYESCQKLKYTEATLHETMRMYPPLHQIERLSDLNKSIDLFGTPVPPGTNVIIPVYSLGRDPELFENPDTFNPERFLGENKRNIDSMAYLPFGFGPRQCIGMRLALIQLKIALVHSLRKVSFVKAEPDHLEMDDFTNLLCARLPIRLDVTPVA